MKKFNFYIKYLVSICLEHHINYTLKISIIYPKLI